MDVQGVIVVSAGGSFLLSCLVGFWLERVVSPKYPPLDEVCDLERRSPTVGPVVEIESRR